MRTAHARSEDNPLNGSRFRIGFAAIVVLVLLRAVVGLHFFTQGAKHLGDPNWSSAGFFRNSSGPLSPVYHSLVPDTSYGWDEKMAVPRESKPKTAKSGTEERKQQDADAYIEWKEEVEANWASEREKISQFYSYDEGQKKQALNIYEVYVLKLWNHLADNREDIELYRHELYRLEQMRDEKPAAEVPFGAERIAFLRATAGGKRATHLGWFKQTNARYTFELLGLRTSQQVSEGDLPRERPKLDTLDTLTAWMIVMVGVCLTLGLFSRTAALVGGLFLLSVVLSQPLAGFLTTPQGGPGGTYPQFLEMMTLFVLATLPVGRWCGLDSFLCRCCRSSNEASSK